MAGKLQELSQNLFALRFLFFFKDLEVLGVFDPIISNTDWQRVRCSVFHFYKIAVLSQGVILQELRLGRVPAGQKQSLYANQESEEKLQGQH